MVGEGPKYFGERNGVWRGVFVKRGLKWDPLRLRLDLAKHSPAGFDWGYPCSGASQLSLAILADHLHDRKRALELYQDFKFRVVTQLRENEWLLTGDEIDEAITQIESSPRMAA